MSFAPFTVAVPGKAILCGEHAVVYGHAALAMPVQRHLRIDFAPRPQSGPKAGPKAGKGPLIEAPCWDLQLELAQPSAQTQVLARAIEAAFAAVPAASRDLLLTIDSELPRSAGLGSSAALAVALVRGLAQLAGEAQVLEKETSRAMEIEKIFHGKPSGVDHSVIASERLLAFAQGQVQETQIPVGKTLEFVIAVIGSHGGTAQRVGNLAQRRERWPQLYQPLMRQIGALSDHALAALAQGDVHQLGALMDVNQGLLNALGVSSAELEQAIFAARAAGAYGAKLSGAGGGGALLALCQDKKTQVLRAFSDLGYQAFESSLQVQ